MSYEITTFFEIKDRGDFIRVEVLGLSSPLSINDSDPRWINAHVFFSLGAFKGDFTAEVTSTDFQPFKEQLSALYASLKGQALFNTLEGQIEIKVNGDGLGHLEIICILQDKCGISNTLEAIFETDQTQLPNLIKQLENITATFCRNKK